MTGDKGCTRVNCSLFYVALVRKGFCTKDSYGVSRKKWEKFKEEIQEDVDWCSLAISSLSNAQCSPTRREQRILQRFEYALCEMKEPLGICFQENGASNIYRSHKFPSNRQRTVGILSSIRGSMRTMLRAITPPRRPRTASKKDTIRECRRVIVSSNNEHPSRPVDRM